MNRLNPFVSWQVFCITMVIVVLLIACSGPENEEIEPSETLQTPVLSIAVDTPMPTVTDEGPKAADIPPESASESLTGVQALDHLAAIILDNNLEARRDLISFATAGCTTADGLSGPPKCEPGQAEGAPVDFLPVMGPGEGLALLLGEVHESLDFQADGLYAAYRRADTPIRDTHFAPWEYGLFFSIGETESNIQYVLVHANTDGHIIRLDFLACPRNEEGRIIEPEFLTCSPRQIIERDAGELLLPPQETEVNSLDYNSTPLAAIQFHPLAGLVYTIDGELWILDENGEPLFVLDEPSARLSSDRRFNSA